MTDVNVHVSLFPLLGLEGLEDHMAFGRIRIKAHPTLKLIGSRHIE